MRNLTMMTDLYQLTMLNAYLETGTESTLCAFDIFFRKNERLEFAVAAGLQQAIEYIKNLHFTKSDIKYLKSLKLFGEKFFKCVENFKFTGDIYAVREGEMVFPHEPLITVIAPIYQAQLIETALLNIINHQTLIATKATKITREAKNATVAEFGLRRAQGPDAGIYGARAAIIGGCTTTSNVMTGKMFSVPVSGTHAHSWVMSFPTELDAFRKYAEIYPDNCLLLVDTYDTLKSGVPNAIKIFGELKAKGKKPIGIRLDSGDLAYLSKRARKMLDEAGFPNAKIFVSGDIDEYIISSLKQQGAKIDAYGVGTKLITSDGRSALGGVYKMSAIMENGVWKPKMKFSDDHEKMTNPGIKTTYRIYGEDGMAAADLICLREETIDTAKPLTIFHPVETWKKMTFEKFSVREIMTKIFEKGELVYDIPTIRQTAAYAKKSHSEFWEEYTRLLNPHIYKVDLSDGLYNLKQKMIAENSKEQN